MHSMTTVRDMNVRSADITLAFLLSFHTKKDLIAIADKLNLYVSPNIAKDKMSQRLADGMLTEPVEIVSRLSKPDLQLLDELVKVGPDAFIQRKQRKTYYMLQRDFLGHDDFTIIGNQVINHRAPRQE